jgi:hypothetical protein
MYAGTAITHSITLTASATFTRPVALALGELPDGVEGTFSSNPVTPGATIDVGLVASPSTMAGTYGLTITASADVLSGTVFVPFTQTAAVTLTVLPTITLSVSPGSRTVPREKSTHYTVSMTATPGLALPATLGAGQLPDGTQGSFVPATISPGDSTTLFITTTNSTPPGTYGLVITASADYVSGPTAVPLTQTTAVTLTVISPTVTLGVSPGSRTLYQGESTYYTVSMTATPEFTAPATLAAGRLPGGTCSFVSPTISPGDSTTLFITTTTSTPLGTHEIAITGTTATLVLTASTTLKVRMAGYLPLVVKRGPLGTIP